MAWIVADVTGGDLDRAEARLVAAVDRAARPLSLVDRVMATERAEPLRATGALARAETRAMARERAARP